MSVHPLYHQESKTRRWEKRRLLSEMAKVTTQGNVRTVEKQRARALDPNEASGKL